MHALNLTLMFILSLPIVVLSSVRCSQQSDAVAKMSGGAVANTAVGNVQPLISLPSFLALVKREGPAVVNISTTQKISVEELPFPGFPSIHPDDPFHEFFADLRQATNRGRNTKPSLWVQDLLSARMATL